MSGSLSGRLEQREKMSKPAFILITTGLKITLLALACSFAMLDKLRSLKKHISQGLRSGSKTTGSGPAKANQAGVMGMTDGPR